MNISERLKALFSYCEKRGFRYIAVSFHKLTDVMKEALKILTILKKKEDSKLANRENQTKLRTFKNNPPTSLFELECVFTIALFPGVKRVLRKVMAGRMETLFEKLFQNNVGVNAADNTCSKISWCHFPRNNNRLRIPSF